MKLPTLKSKKRLLFLMAAVVIAFTALSLRLAVIVFAQGDFLREKALIQQTSDLTVSAKRGDILDTSGAVLARSATAQTVVLRPVEIKNSGSLDMIVSVLSEKLGLAEETIRTKATTKKSEVWLARQVSNDTADSLRKLNLPGVYFAVDVKRYYTNSSFLTQTLGFTTVDGVGQEGLEAYFEKYLAGQDGKIISETDSNGQSIALGQQQYISAIDGYNVRLTINEVIQSYLEQACEEAYYQQNAKSACGIAMDPKTGSILGIANIPDYDLNDPPRDDIAKLNELSRNRIITDVYEPGSTFKVVTCASALDSNAISTDITFDCPGSKIVDGQMIKCWRYPRGHGHQTLYQAVQNSCNVAFMQMGLNMGTETFYDYIYKFGFGQNTGITFPADQNGIVMAEKYVTNRDLARIAFGQSIAVTPLQLISSVSAVVNGGFLYQPSLVKDIEDNDGNIIKKFDPVVVSQPISEQTSATMRDILETVVSQGCGKNCYIPGYRVGGKTGTAQKYDENHQVMTGKHIASFVGFAPADDPQIAVLIIVDEPSVAVDFGSVVAAPYVRKVLQESLQYMGIQPDYGTSPQPEEVVVPDVAGMDEAAASAALAAVGLDYIASGTGMVKEQLPAPQVTMPKGTTVLLTMDTPVAPDQTEGMVVVPDLSGKSIMEAGQALEECKLKLMIGAGQGTASYQDPAANTLVPEGTEVKVEFGQTGG